MAFDNKFNFQHLVAIFTDGKIVVGEELSLKLQTTSRTAEARLRISFWSIFQANSFILPFSYFFDNFLYKKKVDGCGESKDDARQTVERVQKIS